MRPDRLDTAGVFERIFSIYRRQAGVLLPAAAVLYLIPAALSLLNGVTARALALAATIIAGVWYQGMVVQAVRDIQDDVRDLSIGALFRSVSPVLAPLLWTAILVLVGVFLGALAFLIPGLVLFTWWAVAAPVVVIEKTTATQALARSRALVHGYGWQVFSVMIVTLLLVVFADAALATLAAAISDSRPVVAVANLVANILTAPVFALASAVLYLALLKLKGEPLPPAGPRPGVI
jgi:hypothetical protein